MKKYLLGISIQAILVLAVIITSFVVTGTPFEANKVNTDVQKLISIQRMKGEIDLHVTENGQLPQSINDLKFRTTDKADAETMRSLEFKPIGMYTYQLCTTFATSSEDIAQTDYKYFVEAKDLTFSPGYTCLDFEVEKYIQTMNNTTPSFSSSPAPTVYNLEPITITGVYAEKLTIKRDKDYIALGIMPSSGSTPRYDILLGEHQTFNKNMEQVSFSDTTFMIGDTVRITAEIKNQELISTALYNLSR